MYMLRRLLAPFHRLFLPMLVACVPLVSTVSAEDRSSREANDVANRSGLELFEKRIRPTLIKHCYECHAADADELGGELLLDSQAGWQAGGTMGTAIEPGDPDASLLVSALEYDDLAMPPDQQLPEDLIADFRRWVSLGAPDPRDDSGSAETADDDEASSTDPKDLWSLRPIEVPEVPEVGSSESNAQGTSDIDRFILDRLNREGLEPNGRANPATLVRRLHFDLIGLPPSPETVAAFVADPSDEHLAALTDRLLASPQFGERWGRHWLDVARYGESAGSSRDVLMIYAWRYRDYVIDAFNRDVPFNRFVTEQIAGDLLPADDPEEQKRLQIATGLLALGSKSLNGGNLTFDVIDDQIDVVSRAVLGLTVSCARCHDHKFDPIPTADYYSLAGIFLSTETRYGGSIQRPETAADRLNSYLPLGPKPSQQEVKAVRAFAEEIEELNEALNKAQNQVKTLRRKVPKAYRAKAKALAAADEPPDDLDDKKVKLLGRYAEALREVADHSQALRKAKEQSPPEPEYAHGVMDAKKIRDAKILIQGEKNQRGDSVSRGFLSTIEDIDQRTCSSGTSLDPIDDSESGRRHLAAWLVHPENPLTPRVAVNRIWQHLMGSGLVETVDNFGVAGQAPSHPELLDHLAHRFVHEHHWSMKSLIRELVLSRTYQRSSAGRREAETVDPDNRLRWRMPRRRLEAEPLRDAMLTVSGLLRTEPMDSSLVAQIGEGEVGRNLNTSPLDEPFDHRSVYLPIIRGIIPEPLGLFDFPEPSNVQGLRDSNTTPTQALYLMNSDTTIRIAKRFAQRLLSDQSLESDSERIRRAHLLCFGREPSESQLQRAAEFLGQMQGSQVDSPEIAWASYCQTLLASAPFRYLD